MIWYLPVAGAALLLFGFLAGAAVRPKDVRRDVRRLAGDVARAREARDRLHKSLDRAIDVNMGLRRERTEAQRQVINLQLEKQVQVEKLKASDQRYVQLLERLEEADTKLGLVRERVDDTLGSLEMWRDMVERDEYDTDGLPEDLNSLARQLRIDSTSENEAAPALEAGDRL